MKKNIFSAAGFSLLEMMVVIMLVSLMTTLIAYSISLGGKVFARAQTISQQYSQLFDSERWFRQTVVNTASYTKDSLVFSATSSQLSGITTAPLKQVNQAPMLYSWRLADSDDGLLLEYKEGSGDQYETVRSFGYGDGRFEFTDQSGNVHAAWPIGDRRQALPKLITMVVSNDGQVFKWEIFPSAPKVEEVF